MGIYLILYHCEDLPDSPTERREVIARWNRWTREVGEALIDGGNHLKKAKSLTRHKFKEADQGGATAYTIVEAINADEAAELSRTAPPLFDGGRADVYRVFDAAV